MKAARQKKGMLAGLLAAVLGSAGCGVGNRFDGGGFPIGRASIIGRVASAETPIQPLNKVNIVLLATPLSGTEGQVLRTSVNDNGEFTLTDIPTDLNGATVQMTIQPENTTLRSQSLTFQVFNGRRASLLVSLPRTATDVSQATTLSISPPASSVRPGDPISLSAQLRDASNNVLPWSPSLLVSDDIGTIGAGGQFIGRTNGSGTITAFWYNNLRATGSIVVDDLSPVRPPEPPAASSTN